MALRNGTELLSASMTTTRKEDAGMLAHFEDDDRRCGDSSRL
jgi:hypothetical protein